jgi:hypothetical protein
VSSKDQPDPKPVDAAVAGWSLWNFFAGGGTFLAAVVYHLDCGHVRPMNIQLEVGDELECFSCERKVGIVRVEELDEPTEFPLVDQESPDTIDG